jgi:PKD repeat protein
LLQDLAADFLALDTGGCKNSTIRFSDVTSPSGTITKWKWNFGDGQSQTFTTAPFTHKYTDTGYYAVQLIVTDSRGCTDSLNKANVVRITAPAADFYAPKNLFCAGGVMPFKDSSSGLITSYNWSFGDGGSSILKIPHILTQDQIVHTRLNW